MAKSKDPSAFLGQWKGMEEGLPKFLQEFKGYKSDVIKAYLMENKHKSEIGIKVAKDILSKPLPEGMDPAFATKIYKQMIEKDTQRLKDIDEALKEIDVYKATVEKKGVTAHASGGRVPMFAGAIAKLGKFTKSEVLIQMLENTLKGSKDSWTKINLPNFIKELKAKPELANDPQVWNFFTAKLPKNQRLVVHSDDTVDFWRQSEFGPHNIETTNKFMKKHPNLSRDEAVRIQNMEPEDQILEMKRLETIADRSRTKQAYGGVAGMLGE